MFRSKNKKDNTKSKNDFVEDKGKETNPPSWSINKHFFVDPRTKKVLGFICLALGIYFLIAFLSCLNGNWKADQSIIEGGNVPILGTESKKIANAMGFIGAWLSNLFVYKWFGLASLLIPVFLVQLGAKQFLNRVVFPEKLFNIRLLFGGIFISLVLGFATYSINPILGGGFGVAGFETIRGMIGTIGFILFLAIYLVVYLSYAFGVINFSFLKPKTAELAEYSEATETVQETMPVSKTVEEKPMVVDFDEEPKPKDMMDFELVDKSEISFDIDEDRPKTSRLNSTNADDVPLELNIIEEKPIEETSKKELSDHQGIDTLYDPTLDLSSYKFPPFDLLKEYEVQDAGIDRAELEQSKNMIVETLKNYNIGIAGIKANIGPTVTLYEVIPAPGVKISKIKNLEDDIALSLAALGIRIIAPIPGKGAIGIEVPNNKPQMVSMHSVITSAKFQNCDMELPVCLGKTISNEVYVADMAKMPHLLMAGATGQGKSVGLNALLVSLLYKKHPSTVKFVLVDPKKVELTLFNKIERHFLAKLPGDADAIITDNKQVVNTLNSLCIEMDDRYTLLQSAHVRNIKDYNVKFVNRKLNPNDGHKYLPYIVVIIDEVADLIMTAGKEVEHPIGRIAQLARAIGIHLVLATQRPSVNIITGTIKANFPARIAFRVTSKIDSRTILDGNGADQLIGRGDMLYSTGSDMLRLQCPFVDTPEVEKICEYIGEQRGYPTAFMLPEYKDENSSGDSGDFDMNDRDALFEDAARVIVLAQQGSTSLIQRKMKIGYNRAGRIIDQLEHAGIVGAFEGSKAREVLIPDEYSLEQFLKNLGED